MTRRTGLALVALALLLRLPLLPLPGYEDDLRAYRRWAVAAARSGLASVYAESDMDYPPLYAYLLAPLGHAYLALAPRGDLATWTALAKLPPLAFDLATAALLLRLGGPLPALAYLANPAVLFDAAYWGQPDSVHSFFVLAAFVALRERPAAAWALLALGASMKPLAVPFFPLLAIVTLLRHGPRAALRGGAAAAATALAVFAPFLLAGQGGSVLRRVTLDLDAMAFTSVNAHNLWGAVLPWQDAARPLLGPLTATQIGLLLFGAALAALAAKAVMLQRAGGLGPEQTLALAAGTAFAFFMLATHMHENHLFVAIPLLLALVPAGRAFRALALATSLAVLLNLLLHDPLLAELPPLALGGPTGVLRPSHGRAFFAAELLAVRAATLFNLALFAIALATILRMPARTVQDVGRGVGLR